MLGGYEHQNEWIPEIWLKNRSVHKRERWFEKKARQFVKCKHLSILTYDFIKVK